MKGDKLGKQGRRDRQYFFLRFPCSLAFAHPPWPQVFLFLLFFCFVFLYFFFGKSGGHFLAFVCGKVMQNIDDRMLFT